MKKYSFIFFLVMFLIGTDTFLVSPLLPTLSELYGISSSISGWMVSAYALGYALFALISGPFSDGRDRKKVMIFGFIGFASSTFLCGFATSFELMILFRFLAGVSASFVTPQVWASIPVISPKEKIVKMIGMASAGLAISQLIGVPIGSYLAVISWRAPFFAISGASLIMILIVSTILPSLNIQSQIAQNSSIIKIYRGLLKNSLAIKYLVAYLVFQTGNFCMMTFIGSWLTRDFHLGVSGVGTAMIAIGAGNLIGTLFGNKLIARWGIPKSLLIGILSLCILYFIAPFSSSLIMAEVVLTLAFVVNGFIFPIFMTTLQSTTTTARSTISSLSNAAMYTGTTIGGIVGGILFTRFSGFFGIAFFTIATYLVVLLIYKAGGIFDSKKQETSKGSVN
ncbi:MFS transporter [Candidatus Enterococcus ferrettii]|uniref:Major facilitator superfamily (MFS) profile domain-containing protein n=1 Tax=Candidatus Enterococcus ferrettii TaxID=2815324 RepID=A0ABV0ES08_9ENTE|nr:MFS transporter [Enterococcus sp. 665A]MBO1340672.1 MFS transporter [Enterococcus sp. 665A]